MPATALANHQAGPGAGLRKHNPQQTRQLALILVAAFMVVLEGKCTCVKVGRKLTSKV
jgi:hypothetical protein